VIQVLDIAETLVIAAEFADGNVEIKGVAALFADVRVSVLAQPGVYLLEAGLVQGGKFVG
jgi:hypothetical protein